MRRIEQLAVGKTHKCALFEGGGVRCSGKSELGALGYGSYPNHIGDDEHPSAAGDVDLGGSATQISAGEDITCALLTNARVRCWGTMGFRGFTYTPPLGYPGGQDVIGDDETPASVGDIDVGGEVAQITAGDAHVCALLATSTSEVSHATSPRALARRVRSSGACRTSATQVLSSPSATPSCPSR